MARLPAGALRSAQTVAGGLIAAALLALAVAWFMRIRGPGAGIPLVAYIAAGYAVLVAPAVASVLRAARPAPRFEEGMPLTVYVQALQARTIISLGILEGAVMFCVVALIVGPHDWPLVAAAVPLALMVVWFPREE
ncbi:MAG TPA: hypothetical protein VFM29_00260 [Vicinamibacteria bacterium]|nr:hypothetical protein [Vicinamibacteria bacterium]